MPYYSGQQQIIAPWKRKVRIDPWLHYIERLDILVLCGRYRCRPDSGFPCKGLNTFSTELDDTFTFFGSRMYTFHLSNMTNWIYAWVISCVWRLCSSIDAASKRVERCRSQGSVGAFLAMLSAWSSPYVIATNHLFFWYPLLVRLCESTKCDPNTRTSKSNVLNCLKFARCRCQLSLQFHLLLRQKNVCLHWKNNLQHKFCPVTRWGHECNLYSQQRW